MKRDWMLIKQLLQKFEDETIKEYLSGLMAEKVERRLDESEEQWQERKKESDHFKAMVLAQLLLMEDSGMIAGCEINILNRTAFTLPGLFPRLTMKGQDTLDALRNRGIWTKVKDTAKERALPITLELIFEVLKAAVRVNG